MVNAKYAPARPGRPADAGQTDFDELKRLIHGKLVDKLDLTRLGDLEGDTLRREIRLVVEHLCDTENPLLNRSEREKLIEEVLDETFGFGPLEALLKEEGVADIMINGPKNVFLEKAGPHPAVEDHLPRQRPPDADPRPDRVEGRPANR